MYSREERIRAVELQIQYGKRSRTVIRELGSTPPMLRIEPINQHSNYLLGPPPPMRGIETQYHMMVLYIGTTPAHAGNSHRSASRHRSGWDHPRPCGE